MTRFAALRRRRRSWLMDLHSRNGRGIAACIDGRRRAQDALRQPCVVAFRRCPRISLRCLGLLLLARAVERGEWNLHRGLFAMISERRRQSAARRHNFPLRISDFCLAGQADAAQGHGVETAGAGTGAGRPKQHHLRGSTLGLRSLRGGLTGAWFAHRNGPHRPPPGAVVISPAATVAWWSLSRSSAGRCHLLQAAVHVQACTSGFCLADVGQPLDAIQVRSQRCPFNAT